MSDPILSVDYGTSNTVAVLRRPDGQVRPLLFGTSPLLASGVHAHDGELLTGSDAARQALRDPVAYEPYPKRRVDDGEVLLGERSVEVADLIAATLRRVADEAVRVAGMLPPTVVIAHPAAWGSRRKALLLDAAERAGLTDPLLVAEPVAACAHFATLPQTSIATGDHLAVFDLGAGTFDATVVRRTASGFEVVVADGLDDLGAADLDELIVQQVGLTAAAAAPDAWRRLTQPETAADRRHLLELRELARYTKESLSTRSTVELRIPVVERDTHITRNEFETAAAPLLQRTVAMTRAVVGRSGVDATELKGLFLVGGASRIPLASTLLHRGIAVAPTVLDQPELVVAEGGVSHADRLSGSAASASAQQTMAIARVAVSAPADETAAAKRFAPTDPVASLESPAAGSVDPDPEPAADRAVPKLVEPPAARPDIADAQPPAPRPDAAAARSANPGTAPDRPADPGDRSSRSGPPRREPVAARANPVVTKWSQDPGLTGLAEQVKADGPPVSPGKAARRGQRAAGSRKSGDGSGKARGKPGARHEFSRTVVLDGTAARRRARRHSVALVLLAVLTVPLSVMLSGNGLYSNGGVQGFTALVCLGCLVAALVRLIRLPKRRIEVGVDVDARRFRLRYGTFTVDRPWREVARVSLTRGAELRLRSGDPKFAATRFSQQGLRVKNGRVRLGPLDIATRGELAVALKRHAADRFR